MDELDLALRRFLTAAAEEDPTAEIESLQTHAGPLTDDEALTLGLLLLRSRRRDEAESVLSMVLRSTSPGIRGTAKALLVWTVSASDSENVRGLKDPARAEKLLKLRDASLNALGVLHDVSLESAANVIEVLRLTTVLLFPATGNFEVPNEYTAELSEVLSSVAVRLEEAGRPVFSSLKCLAAILASSFDLAPQAREAMWKIVEG